MIDINKQYRTRDGREVKLLMTDGGSEFPVIGAIKNADGRWFSCAWPSNGQSGNGYASLVEVKTKHVLWVNCYTDSHMTWIGRGYVDRESADRQFRSPTRIACIRIEFEEGEGLS